MTEAQKSLKERFNNNGLHLVETPTGPILKDANGRTISGGGGGGSYVEYSQVSNGEEHIGTIKIDGNSTTIKGTKVTASATGSSTNEVKYLKINDTEYKLPEGGGGGGGTVTYTQTSTGTEDIGTLTINGTAHNIKGTKVEVSSEGQSTNEIRYITINGTVYKISGVQIIDSLISQDAYKALSAKQGNVLNTTKQNKITYGTEEPTGGVDGDIYLRYSL